MLPFPRIERKLKTKVVPEYPAVARQLSLQGKVKIDITVSVDGHVTETKVIGGHPLLAKVLLWEVTNI